MARKNNNDLFFTCSLIEYIGRMRKQCRCKIVDYLGMKNVKRIYNYADVFHCEPIEKVATEDIGEIYERLIEDIYQDTEIEKGIWEIYHSWIDAHISDYNTDFYYQSREYIAECYKAGEIL